MVPQASALTAADTDNDCVSSTASTKSSNTNDNDVHNPTDTSDNNRQASKEMDG